MSEKTSFIDNLDKQREPKELEGVEFLSEQEAQDCYGKWNKIVRSGRQGMLAYDSFATFIKKIKELYKKYQSGEDPESPIKKDPNDSLLFQYLIGSSTFDAKFECFDYQGEWSMRGFVDQYQHLLPPETNSDIDQNN